MSTAEELKLVKDIAAATGIVLDPVYRCNTFLLCVALYLIFLHDSPSIQVKNNDIFLSVKFLSS
jgi:hypothetical protein